jgi:hypothetical protein
MRILRSRQQYIADHSSTNYLFYAAKPLSREARAVVSRLSSHVDVEARTAQITYHSEFADLGEERRRLFLSHYDVEVREDYDWWSLSVMLEKERVAALDFSQYTVEDETSLIFDEIGDRIRLRLEGAHLDYNAAYGEFGEEVMEGLAELGLALREELYAGQQDALNLLKAYCEDKTILPGGPQRASEVGQTLRTLLEPI